MPFAGSKAGTGVGAGVSTGAVIASLPVFFVSPLGRMEVFAASAGVVVPFTGKVLVPTDSVVEPLSSKIAAQLESKRVESKAPANRNLFFIN